MNTLFNIPCKIYIHQFTGENVTGLVYFTLGIFVLGFVSLIKAKRGNMPYIFTGMRPFETLFLSMVIMFYIFASFKHQIRITKYTDFVEADDNRKWPVGGGQKLCR